MTDRTISHLKEYKCTTEKQKKKKKKRKKKKRKEDTNENFPSEEVIETLWVCLEGWQQVRSGMTKFNE